MKKGFLLLWSRALLSSPGFVFAPICISMHFLVPCTLGVYLARFRNQLTDSCPHRHGEDMNPPARPANRWINEVWKRMFVWSCTPVSNFMEHKRTRKVQIDTRISQLVICLLFLSLLRGTPLPLAAAQDTSSELEALRNIRDSFNATFLNTNWNGSDFCRWVRVGCDNEFHVDTLDLSNIRLSGTLHPSLGNLTRLSRLDVHGNSITGRVPDSVASLSNLSYVDLSGNIFSGSIPESLCNLSFATLQFLSVVSNNLTGPIPSGIGRCISLTGLYLGNNSLTGSLPDSFGNLTNLLTLDVSNNRLWGSMPLLPTGLEFLILDSNGLNGTFDDKQETLPSSLKIVTLSRNRFHGRIAEQFGTLPNLNKLDLRDNEFSGPIPDSWSKSSEIGYIDLSQNNLSGVLPFTLTQCANLSSVTLNQNRLSGSLPPIGNMTSLSNLDLSNNQFTGEIPYDSILSLRFLTLLNLSSNDLAYNPPVSPGFLEKVKQGIVDVSMNPSWIDYLNPSAGDPRLAPAPADSPTLASDEDSRKGSGSWSWIIIFTIDGILALVDAFALYKYLTLPRPKEIPKVPEFEPECSTDFVATVPDLMKATDSFHEDNIVGYGARSIVYRGRVGSGQIAVKVLKWDSEQKEKETLIRELQTLGGLRHRNLLRILAVCYESTMKALVLEYMPFSSLENYLYNMVGRVCLSWNTRFNILVGVAQGLIYLHDENDKPIIHCDLKPSNILLDTNFEPKVADFGIAKFVHQESSKDVSMSNIFGTMGYIPPEYAWASSASTKGDVYSFGIILLETLTAKPPCSNWDEIGRGSSLVEFAASADPDNIIDILDPNMVALELDCDLHHHELMMVLNIGLMCTQQKPKDRPDIKVVLKLLTEVKISRFAGVETRPYPSLNELVHMPIHREFDQTEGAFGSPRSSEEELEKWMARRMGK